METKYITEDDLLAVLGGMVIALCSTMPPDLARRCGQALRTTARAAADDGRTKHDRLLQGLADAADAAANLRSQ
ncbi:MAG: hypothetical protein MUF08_18995 [Burkholderiaceae bacterium]|jgi:hypothetical protein|nr:hypothetical protein [Burkholderiaceae bacterium]